jgi:glycosyltransferase involved in cell wall biosynthesis
VVPTRRIPVFAPGGASHHVRCIARGFAEIGAEVLLVAARGARDGVPEVEPGVPVRIAARGRLPGVLRRRRAWDERVDAFALAREVPSDVDLVYERHALFATIGGPRVVELNAPAAWEAVWFEGMAPDPALLRAEARQLQSASLVVAVSPPLAEYAVRRGVHPDRIRVVPNGGIATPSRPHEGFVVGYAGTFKPWQGMVGALSDLDVVERPLRLELWGDGPDREAVTAAARAAGHDVRWCGWGIPDRGGWDVAWVPRGRWPPPGPAFDEPPPACYFSPLKEADAAASSLPILRDGSLRRLPIPPTWAEVAGTILGAAGVEHGKMPAVR